MDLIAKVNRNIVDIVKLVLINEKQKDIGKKEILLIVKELFVKNVAKIVLMF